jgi:RNA polymerase sigma-70 factor, ECF subfamily
MNLGGMGAACVHPHRAGPLTRAGGARDASLADPREVTRSYRLVCPMMSRVSRMPGSGRATGVRSDRPAVGGPAGAVPPRAGTGSRRTAGDSEIDFSSLLPAAQRGDEVAFQVIYRAVHPGVLRYVRVLVGDDAEDVASEAWLQVVRDLASFHGDAGGFRGWVVTIARHRALDHLRARRRRPQAPVPVEEFSQRAGPDDTEGSAFEEISTDRALALIAGLPREQAEAVLLRVVVGLDAKTAGQVLGKRAGAVRTAAYRGLARLAEQLAAAEPGPGDLPVPPRRAARRPGQ